MQNLKKWEEIIIEKSQKIDFKDFLKKVASWKIVNLYNNKWLISKFPNTDRVSKIVDYKDFNTNRDLLTKNWLYYNFEIDFFKNFQKLLLSIKLPNLLKYLVNENSDYTDEIGNIKNWYLAFSCVDSENILYSSFVRKNCHNVLNCISVFDNCQNIYFSIWISNSSDIFYSKYIVNSYNIYFSSNLIWCSDCIWCSNLENKKYYINNFEYSKKDFFIKKNEILKNKDNYKYDSKLRTKWINYWSKNVIWSFLINSNDVMYWYYSCYIHRAKNILFFWWLDNNQNIYNVISWAWNSQDVYLSSSVWLSSKVFSSINVVWTNLYYSFHLENCSFCFWCIGLKNKSYCILNKQYTKYEWYVLVNKIFSQMNEDWNLWNFFPWYLNPYYFNDTFAGLIWKFNRKEIEKEWYLWRDKEIKVDIPEWINIIEIDDLKNYEWYDVNWKWYIDIEILKKAIKDKKWNYYRIVKTEYDFLMKNWLPLPRMHWLDRIKEGLTYFNLWKK